eukprot:5162340-Prymnesium_polylepis.1
MARTKQTARRSMGGKQPHNANDAMKSSKADEEFKDARNWRVGGKFHTLVSIKKTLSVSKLPTSAASMPFFEKLKFCGAINRMSDRQRDDISKIVSIKYPLFHAELDKFSSECFSKLAAFVLQQ